ncbi:MAG TPA: DUF2959 family protein [Tepidisphaeraceae bacterium]|nr:DUF2959 family protein [Tepidisphaeraceae bacterium]
MRIGQSILLVLGMIFSMLSIGCASQGGASKAVSSIVDTRIEVVKAQNRLNETLAALDNLQKAGGTELPSAYDKFKSAMDDTREQKKRAEERAVSMRENSAEYQKKWEEEVTVLNNPDLKTSAEQRVANVREGYADIRETATDCRQQYAVLDSDLMDINRYFSNDLNAASLEKAKPVIATALQHGQSLHARLNDLVIQMNRLSAEMNPTGRVPEK